MGSLLLVHLLFIAVFFIELSKISLAFYKIQFDPAFLYIGSFFVLILFGTGLLLLPNTTTEGISVIDAFFTATSAVCVTGLDCT
jgi:Trk-type K+ transport system membrane component